MKKFWTITLALIVSATLFSCSEDDPTTPTHENKWIESNAGTSANLNAIYFVDDDWGYACGEGVVLKTTDAGETWTKIREDDGFNFIDLIAFNRTSLCVAAQDKNAEFSEILNTSDAGITWISKKLEAEYIPMTIAAAGGKVWVSGGFGPQSSCAYSLVYYADAGDTNYTKSSTPPFNWIATSFFDANDGILVSNSGNISKTNDGARNVNPVSNINGLASDMHFFDRDRGIVASTYSGIFSTSDGGENWITSNELKAGVLGFDNTGRGFAAKGDSLFKTVAEDAWQFEFKSFSRNILDIFVSEDGKTWIVGEGGLIYSNPKAFE